MNENLKNFDLSKALIRSEIQAEESLIKNIIFNESPKLRNKVIPVLKQEMFTSDVLGKVFEVVKQLFYSNKHIDYVTVSKQTQKNYSDINVKDLNVLFTNTSILPDNAIIDYANIVIESYLRLKIIKGAAEIMLKANDNSVDLPIISEAYINNLNFINEKLVNEDDKSFKTSIQATVDKINNPQKEQIYWPTKEDCFDYVAPFMPNEIYLIGGKQGSGKTRFLIHRIIKLLQNNENVAIKWVNMEDRKEKIIMNFFVSILGLDYRQLRGFEELSDNNKEKINELKKKIESWDIEFSDISLSISEIQSEFIKFCVERKDKFCLLIIDNIMLLKDHQSATPQTQTDDQIAMGIKIINEIVNNMGGIGSSILMVHHFVKDQASKINNSVGYRPSNEHLKGSSRYADISTIIFLINRLSQYRDIIDTYEHLKEIMSSLFLIDVTKNRDSSTGLIRYFADLKFLKFTEINHELYE